MEVPSTGVGSEFVRGQITADSAEVETGQM